jgi:hypothetical protein
MWLVSMFATFKQVARVMQTAWGWPLAESLHFIGLSLLIGTIGLFDLRLLGLGRRIPIASMHRLVKWGVLGFAVNVLSGLSFLMTEPDQYIYNPSFQFKMLFIMTGGLNALAFYTTSYRRVTAGDASADAPRVAKVIAAISLSMWISVIVAGRLLTFYRPAPCEPPEPRFLAACIPGFGNQYRK